VADQGTARGEPARGGPYHATVVSVGSTDAALDGAVRSAPGRRPPRGRPGRHTTESLLAVAAAVFNEHGYDGATIRQLAEAAGLSKSSIYHRVEGKEELLSLAIDRALERLFGLLAEPGAVTGEAVQRLEFVVRRTTEVLVEELPYVTLLLRVRGNSATERRAIEERRRFDHEVADLVRLASLEGDVRGDLDPELVTRLIFGMVNSIAEWFRPERGSSDRLAATVVAIVLDGARRPREQPKR
jgi:AcrR family transcriptional regulator